MRVNRIRDFGKMKNINGGMKVSSNPFSKGSQRYRLFEILSNLKWHCANCELPGSQPAATIRDLRRKGYDIISAARKGADRSAIFCKKCGVIRTHYKLNNLKPVHSPKERSSLPDWLVERILKLYDQREAISNRKRHPKALTVDHRVPNIRWKESEETFKPNISDIEIREKFQLLTNEDNLWKSRMCEECVKTGIRQPFMNLNFFYIGSDKYDENIGCKGCGWHNPNEWKKELNDLFKQLKQTIEDFINNGERKSDKKTNNLENFF